MWEGEEMQLIILLVFLIVIYIALFKNNTSYVHEKEAIRILEERLEQRDIYYLECSKIKSKILDDLKKKIKIKDELIELLERTLKLIDNHFNGCLDVSWYTDQAKQELNRER